MGFLCAQGVVQVKAVHTKLVGHHHHHVVRHPLCHPMVAADGLHPPDFLFVVEGDAVGLVGAVLLQKLTEPEHALPGGADVGQDQDQDVLLADAPGDLLLPAGLGLLQLHQGICRQDAGVGGDGFGGGHADASRVDAGGSPDAVGGIHAGAGCVGEGLLGKLHHYVGKDALVAPLLLLRCDDHQLLFIKMAVVGSCDHGGTIVGRAAADQDCGARHSSLLPFCFCQYPYYSTEPRFWQLLTNAN